MTTNTDRTRLALDQSAAHWEAMARGDEPISIAAGSCALCVRFYNTCCELNGEKCPIFADTSAPDCAGNETYSALSNFFRSHHGSPPQAKARKLAKAGAEYLRSLQVGDLAMPRRKGIER